MKLRSLFVSLLIIVSSCLAFADLAPVGEPVLTGSWTQQFVEDGVGPFNNINFNITTPGVTWGDLNHPNGMDGFDASDGSDWGSVVVNGTNAWAYDNWYGVGYPDSLTFYATFSTDPSTPFTAIFFAWNDQELVDNLNVSWDGQNWTITPVSTPEPASLMLVAGGLLGLVLRKRIY